MAVPPRLTIPDSNVSRVLSDGFSKNIAICLPASAREKTDGRDFISSARCSTASTPCGPRSRVETKSGHQKIPGDVSGATGALLCNELFNFGSSFQKVSKFPRFQSFRDVYQVEATLKL